MSNHNFWRYLKKPAEKCKARNEDEFEGMSFANKYSFVLFFFSKIVTRHSK